ncbi:MAG: hypothetical protein ABS56_12725 [Lautropia sp. SCN 69-89]|nr:MAG: hypothetical protein ABS56_12725 [Lautropia sp. SCN 69-89]
MREPTVFLDLPRGREMLRVSVSEFKGTTYADIRVWYFDRGGELRPGTKGVSLRSDAIAAVVEALQAAQDALAASAGNRHDGQA